MTTINHEPIRDRARLATTALPTAADLDLAIANVLARIDRTLPDFTDQFPAPSSEGLVYPAIGNIEWTNGFWTGMLWLAYELTGEARYRAAAETQVRSFLDRAEQRINVAHHDLGFLYTPSACAALRLTGDADARRAGLLAADLLLERFDPVSGVIQAWGDLNDPAEAGRMIIDCNLNLPLLYWATAQTGDAKYRDAAEHHLTQAARYLVRADASTFHTFHMDTATGAPLRGTTHQGHGDDSCWARGQAWGIYGFALGYAHSGREALVGLSASLANYFLNRLPDDLVCRWDLIFTDGDAPADTSAAAIAACGLLELVRHLPASDPDRDLYTNAAWGMVRRLDADHLAPLHGSNGVLAHGVYHMPKRIGVNECCIWGDYFHLEALVRLRRVWRPYW
ncbi:glycoside hydrolase family 88 protein [Niveispirillum sp. KHB5.9]|uniref:glycoside hydrolase family 88 protein n=1 Tax=Niveispirillum sp. KHB5.9 TaxID=3400269 RepID=UPI003A877382